MRRKWWLPILIGVVTCAAFGACSADDLAAQVQRKARDFQDKAPAWVAAGGDPKRIEPLGRQLDGFLKAGNLPEANATLDAILTILNEPASTPPVTAQQTEVLTKAHLFQDKAPAWVAAGGDPKRIEPLGQQLDGFLKAGKLAEASHTLDALLAILDEPPAASRQPSLAQALPAGVLNPTTVKLGKIPSSAEIIYHADGFIYVMDIDGNNATQITFEHPRHWEHVAASYDRRRIVANERGPGANDSRLWLFDLHDGTETPLLPQFKMAGNGGVDWDAQGFVYFAALEKEVRPNPKTAADFVANAGANDIYKVRYDGTQLTRLTNTPDRGEADVSVSADGKFITYMATKIAPPDGDTTEIWMANSDGTNRRLVYAGGKPRVRSVHDPEFSPDGTHLVFSQVNPNFTNFPSDPNANTAHDLYIINIDGSGLTRVTPPGPISIIPDWKGNWILYLELTDKTDPPYRGISLIHPDGSGHQHIKNNANIAKFIP